MHRPARQPIGGRGDRQRHSRHHKQVANSRDKNRRNQRARSQPPPSRDNPSNSHQASRSMNSNSNNANNKSYNRNQIPLFLRDQWNYPSSRNVYHDLRQYQGNDICKKSYESLLLHDNWPEDVEPNWQPFANVLCFMLWLGYNDSNLNMTRIMLQWIINLLLTLQFYNVIKHDIWIPTDASTIGKWNRWFPDPPICMYSKCGLIMCAVHCKLHM